MRSYRPTSRRQKKSEQVKWFLIDAEGKTLGRLASEVAKILRGKHRPDFSPDIDCGDGVVIVNADRIVVSGAKSARKIYRYYTGRIGGLREIPYETMAARHPTYPVERAVKGMMPKTRLGNRQLKRLRVFAGNTHTMAAQQPILINC